MALPTQFHLLRKPTIDGHVSPDVVRILAFQIVTNPNISLVFGYLAGRSHYADGTHQAAPGGEVMLDVRMLRSVLELSRYYALSIAEFAGGCHATTAHYRGVAFDVNRIDGIPVGISHPRYKQFMDDCQELGATKVIGPPSAGHATHVHAQWA
jgi:hypothetical protein